MIDPQFNDEWFREDNETSVTNSQVIIFYTYIEIRKCSYCLHITQSKYINVGQNYTRNWPYDKFGPRFEARQRRKLHVNVEVAKSLVMT